MSHHMNHTLYTPVYPSRLTCFFDIDGVIIETTGLADPAPVVQTFFVDEDIKDMYSLDSVITVVDAHVILDRLAEEKP
jgi:G3E family GTPase